MQRISGDLARLSAARTASLRSEFAAKIAALSSTLSLAERAAAIERIKSEEAAAMAMLVLEMQREGERQRRASAASLSTRHRMAWSALSQRQRRERAVLAIRTRSPRHLMTATRTPRHAVRKLAVRLSKQISIGPPLQ